MNSCIGCLFRYSHRYSPETNMTPVLFSTDDMGVVSCTEVDVELINSNCTEDQLFWELEWKYKDFYTYAHTVTSGSSGGYNISVFHDNSERWVEEA